MMIYEEFLTIENIKSVFHKLEFTHDFKTLIPVSLWSISIEDNSVEKNR